MFTTGIRRSIEIKIKVIVKFVRRKLIGPKISEKMRHTKKKGTKRGNQIKFTAINE